MFFFSFVLFGRAVHVSVVTITVGSSVICQPCMKIRGALNLVHTIFVLWLRELSSSIIFCCPPLHGSNHAVRQVTTFIISSPTLEHKTPHCLRLCTNWKHLQKDWPQNVVISGEFSPSTGCFTKQGSRYIKPNLRTHCMKSCIHFMLASFLQSMQFLP